MVNLWESIFTPGPTPTLLIATNATFACLQLLLFTLLIATYSVHFVVLSILTAGLWWAVNWFAREIEEAKKKEDEAVRIRGLRRKQSEGPGADTTGGRAGVDEKPKVEGTAGGEGEGMDSGDDTETETGEIDRSGILPPRDIVSGGFNSTAPSASTSGLAPVSDEALKQRRTVIEPEALSTDSEWEKVSEGER